MSLATIPSSGTVCTPTQWYSSGASTTTTLTTISNAQSNYFVINTGPTAGTGAIPYFGSDPARLAAGCSYDMPDGSKVIIDDLGNYTIEDKAAMVVYRASRVRDFNPFLNASDLLEQYIEELVPQGIKQNEVLHLEIEHFIYWLVCKAAERDNDPIPADFPQLPDLRAVAARQRFPRCRCCGRFIRRAWAAAQIHFCSPVHMERQIARMTA